MLNSVHDNWMDRLAFSLAFILVLMGLANNLPNIPGLLELIQSIPGLSELPRISKYNSEFFFPLTFTFMTVVVLLRSRGRDEAQCQTKVWLVSPSGRSMLRGAYNKLVPRWSSRV